MVIKQRDAGSLDQPYHAFDAAAQLARYALASGLCTGKRVLDVACGEGHGASLLRRWGASRVVGVDAAAETIAAAQRLSADPAIEFLCCDADALPERLGADARFDVIVWFATLGCVPDPKQLLQSLRALLADGGVMLVNCPNSRIAVPDDARTPHYPTAYGFDDFRRLCEQSVGPVTQWMIETPGLGAVQIPLDQLAGSNTDVSTLLQDKSLGHALLLPPQADPWPSLDDCIAYIAIWGAKVSSAAVMSPVSGSNHLVSWRRIEALERAEAELARMQHVIEDMRIENRRLLAEQQEDRRQLLLYAEQAAVHLASQSQFRGVLDGIMWKATNLYHRFGARFPRTARLMLPPLRAVWRSTPVKLRSRVKRASLAGR